ncbi:MAG: fibronectin type III domain-containing protein, partial [Nitrospirota bacterium]
TTPPDTTAPVISSVSAGNIITTGVTITWTTNEASSSKIEYGTTQTYGSQSNVDNTLVTTHTVVLSGLTPNTIYYFRVISSDQAGNQGISAGSNFTTQKVPQPDTPTAIQDLTVRIGASTRNSLILDWTATGADGIEGTASAYDLRMSTQKIIENGVTAAQGEINFSNAVTVTGVPVPKAAGSTESAQVGQLVTNSVYYFAIKAVDEKGNVSGISNVSNSTNLPPLPVTAIRQGYTMISLPLVPSTTDVQTLFGGIVGTTAELYWWSSNGLGGSDGAFIAETNIVAGYGYMLKSDTANAVLNITGTAITDPSRVIPLQPGWNMIGNPYSSEVAIRNTYVRRVSTGELKSYEDAVIAGWLGNAIYNFNGSTYDFNIYTDATLKLWQGYWVSILQGDQYELIIYKP